jgi:putative membrane protein
MEPEKDAKGSEKTAQVLVQTERAVQHTKAAAVNASHAAEETQRAARQTAASASVAKSSAERTTELAADRTVLAFERTYAAWMRTGLVALASGIGARKLLDGAVPPWMAAVTGIVLVLFSAFCFGAAVWRHLFRVEEPAPDAPKLAGSVLVVVSAFLALVALAVLVGLAFGGRTSP